MKILITGDVSDWNISNFSIKRVSKKILKLTKAADLCIYNLEGPIVNNLNNKKKLRSNKIANYFLEKMVNFSKKEQPIVTSSNKIIDLFKINPNSIVTLANNHIKDHGKKGFKNTIKTLNKNKIKYIGAGRNLKTANRIITVKKISIINTNWVSAYKFFIPLFLYNATPKDYGASYLSIKKLKKIIKKLKQNNKVITIIHAGKEKIDCIKKSGLSIEALKSLNADACIIHHSHSYLPNIYEKDNIFFIGDLIFHRPNHLSQQRQSALIEIEFTNKKTISRLTKFKLNEPYKYN
jgi:phage-related tail protein